MVNAALSPDNFSLLPREKKNRKQNNSRFARSYEEKNKPSSRQKQMSYEHYIFFVFKVHLQAFNHMAIPGGVLEAHN